MFNLIKTREEIKKIVPTSPTLPYCTACATYLTNGKQDLLLEGIHSCNASGCSLFDRIPTSVTIRKQYSEEKKVVLATIRLCLLTAEKNLSFNLIDWHIPTLKASFPDSLILEKKMMSRIGSYLISTLVERLNSTPWSLVIDETTDVSISAALAIVAQVYSAKDERLMVSLIEIANCCDATAIVTTDTVFGVFEKVRLKTNISVDFCADTCNVMFGAHNSVARILSEKIPFIVTVKCNCHMSHLCSHKASLEMPKICEDVVRGTCTHFSRSPKRREAFKHSGDKIFNF
ncbi:Uncharacterized protein APZ42_016234 [Daphnia magna]|uniref:DUF4371 domain-containing protein n=1 Tax=Daphnia magna TaxID=35525 RepID=A0A165AJ07_9CRUS|nr:Uncharacterized protein APZ42_016234 [Daphnia magna]